MVLTMAAVAAAKKMKGAGFRVIVRLTPYVHAGDGADVSSEIVLDAAYSDRERRILFNSARACELHHILRGPIRFYESLEAEPNTRSTAANKSCGPNGLVT